MVKLFVTSGHLVKRYYVINSECEKKLKEYFKNVFNLKSLKILCKMPSAQNKPKPMNCKSIPRKYGEPNVNKCSYIDYNNKNGLIKRCIHIEEKNRCRLQNVHRCFEKMCT